MLKEVPIHSGSLRVVTTKDTSEPKKEIVDNLIEIEKDYKDLSKFSSKISLALNDLGAQLGLIEEIGIKN